MGNRREEGFGSGFGMAGYDPHAQWEGPVAARGVGREPGRVRRYHPDEEMGGGEWVGPMGRPGSGEEGPYGRYYGPSREHAGFGGYAGGGDRDDYRRFSSRDRDERDFADYGYGRERDGWMTGFGQYGRGRFGISGRGEHDWGMMMDRYPMWADSRYAGFEQRWGRGADMGFAEFDEDRGPFYGHGPKGYKRSDERIREDLCDMIFRQGFIDASDVEVLLEGGVVRLVGTVSHRQDKRALEQMAERIHGVDEVRNELRLKRDRHEGDLQGRYEQHRHMQPHNGKNARS